MTGFRNILITVSIFSLAMGFMESAVVVYIRGIYYPGGFDFPLVQPEGVIAVTEILREAATMVMLIAVGLMAGRNASERFAWFLYSFAVWDIFYYVFLKLLIGWPESLMTWDILYLIPVAWVGPVLAPVLVSITMMAFALLILLLSYRYGKVLISPVQWIILVAGALVLILSFTTNYSGSLPDQDPFSEIPQKFNYLLFSLGEGIILSGIILFFRQTRSARSMRS